MADAFELIRRVGGTRTTYQIRTAGGTFKTYVGADLEHAVDISERNIDVDIAEGAVDLEEYIEFERSNPFAVDVEPDLAPVEEIVLDDFAAVATEATPLLATGGAAVASTSGTGTAVLAGGGLLVGAAVIGGIVAGTQSSDDPPVSLPDHHYLGPGNTLTGAQPIDSDDHIALDHDIRYDKATSQFDIQEADRIGAHDFLTDVIENNNPHSILGFVGLKTKEKVESVVGVQYPPNLPPTSPTGMSRSRRAGKYPIHKDPSKHPEFPQSLSHRRYVWDAWNRNRQNHGLPRVDPPRRLGLGFTHRPPVNGRSGIRPPSDSIPFKEFRNALRESRGPVLDHFLDEAVVVDMSSDEREEVENLVRGIDDGSIPFTGDSGVAGPSHAPDDVEMPMETRGSKRPHDGDQGGSGGPANPVDAVAAPGAGGTGHNSKSDGGFDSAQGPESLLPKGGYTAKGGFMKFKKVHRMKSYAIPYWAIPGSADRSGSNYVTTPLAKIPWEYVFFYMTPEEFDLLPAGAYIDSVYIKIMQTVATTGFPTGATTSTIATTNHPKVLCVGKDLEQKCRGGVDKALTLTSGLIPSIAGDASTTFADFILKQYGTDQTIADNAVVVPGCAHKIPYYNRNHFCIYQPNRAQALARGFFTEVTPGGAIDENNAPGFEYFQNYITEINANDTSWDHVDAMSYKFESAPIGVQYPQLEILTDPVLQSTGNAIYYNAKRTISNMNVGGNTSITESFTPSSRNTLPVVTYSSAPIEKGSYFVRGDKAHTPARQPSYHIGMRAIDKSAPEDADSRSSAFVQANIEFEIEATIMINLPSYPNRFTRPKFYNTSIENVVQGINAYPAFSNLRHVTFGLYNESATAPAVAAVDQIGNERTEDDMVVRPRKLRPRRDLPKIHTSQKRQRTT